MKITEIERAWNITGPGNLWETGVLMMDFPDSLENEDSDDSDASLSPEG